MAKGYVHVEVELAQSSKRPGLPCGDVVRTDRTPAATTLVCADGIGSGIRAHIAAEMCASRLIELLDLGHSLRKAFAALVRTMEQSRDPTKPFAAFSVARVLNDGSASILAYEAPAAVLLSRRHAAALNTTPVELGGALATEAHCYLEAGDGLMLMSDGITQAGLGCGSPAGWQTEGVLRFVNDRLSDGTPPKELPLLIRREANRMWIAGGDDCTVAMALCRRGQVVNVLTGPPGDRDKDVAVVRRFMKMDGLKIVCGGSTAGMIARVLGEQVSVEQEPKSLVAPPRYEVPGIDLVTEGAVTLNQVYNIFDEDLKNLKEDSGVTELCALLQIADRVNILQGSAVNRAAGDISFRQRGILTRDRIVPLLAQRLREAGKLVVIDRL